MKRKTFALRINPEVLDAMQSWAEDELRSVNAQIEYVLRDSLRRSGRLKGENESKSATRRASAGRDSD